MPPNSEPDTRWSLGLIGHAALSIFAGEKYVLANDPASVQTAAQYEGLRRYGDTYVFRNEFFLPLGLTFVRYVPEEVFRTLPTAEKAEVLLRAVVLSNKDEAEREKLSEATIQQLEQEMTEMRLPAVVAKRRQSALTLTSFRQTQIEGIVRLEEPSILVLQMPFAEGWRAFQDARRIPVFKVDMGLLGMALDPGEHLVTLRYGTPYLMHAFVLSCLSLLILAAGAWRWPRFQLTT
jgi:uncharacterized membrane protein YfhO